MILSPAAYTTSVAIGLAQPLVMLIAADMIDIEKDAFVSVGTMVFSAATCATLIFIVVKDRVGIEKRISTSENDIKVLHEEQHRMDAELSELRGIARSLSSVDEKLIELLGRK